METKEKKPVVKKQKPKTNEPPKLDVRFRKATVHDTMDVKELLEMFHKEYLNELGLDYKDVIFKKIAKSGLLKTTWVAHLPDEVIPAEYRNGHNEAGDPIKIMTKQEDIKLGKVVGVFSGAFTNYVLDDSKMFHELVWYVHPDYRQCGMELYKYCEFQIRAQKAVSMVMTHMATDKSDRLESLYKRIGYKPLETHYIKRLDKE